MAKVLFTPDECTIYYKRPRRNMVRKKRARKGIQNLKMSRKKQSCEMSNLLHGANFLNQILPQESAEIAKYLAPRRNKMKTKGYFWGTKAEHSII